MKKDELQIIMRILSGKTEEFSYFMDVYGQQVFTLVVRIVNSEEDAEEVTQDVFMKAYMNLSSFNGISSFSTWLYRIAYNTAISYTRKRKNEEYVVDDKVWNTISDTEVDDALSDESEAQIELLMNALQKLSPEDRALITLYYEEEKSVKEISSIFNLSESNVKVRLFRLRKKLYIEAKK